MDRFEAYKDNVFLTDDDNLHSSMDRFEAPPLINNHYRFFYLHSSMDRFEAYYCVNFRNRIRIYIPVWIDLKHIIMCCHRFL